MIHIFLVLSFGVDIVLGTGWKEKEKALGAGDQDVPRNLWFLSVQVRQEAECGSGGIYFSVFPLSPSASRSEWLFSLFFPTALPGPPDIKLVLCLIPAPCRSTLPRPVPHFGITARNACRCQPGQPSEWRRILWENIGRGCGEWTAFCASQQGSCYCSEWLMLRMLMI